MGPGRGLWGLAEGGTEAVPGEETSTSSRGSARLPPLRPPPRARGRPGPRAPRDSCLGLGPCVRLLASQSFSPSRIVPAVAPRRPRLTLPPRCSLPEDCAPDIWGEGLARGLRDRREAEEANQAGRQLRRPAPPSSPLRSVPRPAPPRRALLAGERASERARLRDDESERPG